MSRYRRRIAIIATLPVALGVFSILVLAQRSPVARQPDQARQERRSECPHDYRVVINGEVLTEVPLAGRITNVPQFHDCQRLLVPEGRPTERARSFQIDNAANYRFGPMVGLFVSEELDEFEAGLSGATIIEITPGDVDTMLQQGGQGSIQVDTTVSTPATGKAVAIIQMWNYDTEVYPALGIGPGFTCVYLTNSPMWMAFAVNINTHTTCRSPLSTTDLLMLETQFPERVKRLAVNQMSPLARPEQYPAVGRFDWNWVRREHYISIRCGKTRWCEIGAGAVSSSPDVAGTPQHLWRVKGWHDEQRLIDISTGTAVVAPFRGTAVPDKDLEDKRIADFEAGWVRVAEIYLTRANDAYKQKYNFDVTQPGSGNPNVLHYRKNGQNWQAMIISATGDTAYRRVLRKQAPRGVDVPPTARWRWLLKDETVWTECDEGCCELSDVAP